MTKPKFVQGKMVYALFTDSAAAAYRIRPAQNTFYSQTEMVWDIYDSQTNQR